VVYISIFQRHFLYVVHLHVFCYFNILNLHYDLFFFFLQQEKISTHSSVDVNENNTNEDDTDENGTDEDDTDENGTDEDDTD
jgi:hypothetical protein